MTQSDNNTHTIVAAAESLRVRRRRDPILEELWEIKRQLNKEAGY